MLDEASENRYLQHALTSPVSLRGLLSWKSDGSRRCWASARSDQTPPTRHLRNHLPAQHGVQREPSSVLGRRAGRRVSREMGELVDDRGGRGRREENFQRLLRWE